VPNDEGGARLERWAEWREQTPALREYAYMNSGFSGPKRRATHEAVQRRLDLELMHGSTTRHAMDDRFDLAARYRESMARLLGGASADEIAITGNTTEGINIVVNGLGVGADDCVVTTDVEHGSGIVPAYYQRERTGCEVVIVPVDPQDSAGRSAASYDFEGGFAPEREKITNRRSSRRRTAVAGTCWSTERRRPATSRSRCARAASTSTRCPRTSGCAGPTASARCTCART
jgi:hypothetical protein